MLAQGWMCGENGMGCMATSLAWDRPLRRPHADRATPGWPTWLRATCRPRRCLLVMLAGLPVLAAAWAVLSPPVMLSKTMTQDLLFNLAGAWHLYSGHVAHVDFHDASGRLSFLLTALGFHLVGPVALRLPRQRGDHGRGVVRGSLPGRDAPPASAAGRDLRGVREPARPDAGECRRPAGAVHLRDVLQSLWLERLQHPGADPVRAAARSGNATTAPGSTSPSPAGSWRRCSTSRSPTSPPGWRRWALPCCSIATSAVLAGVAGGRRLAGPRTRWRRTIGRTWPTSWAGRRAAPCARRPMLHFNNFVAAIDQYGPYLAAVAVGAWMWWSRTGDVPVAADARLPAGHVAVSAVAELAGRGHAVGHRRAVRALRPAAHRVRFPRQSRRRAVAADAAAVSAVRRRQLRHQHRGLPCERR